MFISTWCTSKCLIRNISKLLMLYSSVSSVAQSCPTLCNPMNPSTPGLPVHHQLPESTQTHAHWVGDAIQPSHPLSSPSPPALNLYQNHGLFKWVSSSNQVAKVLEFQLQHRSFQWISGLISFRMGWLDLLLTQIPPNQKTQKEQKLRWALRAKERAFYWQGQPEKEAQ